MGEQVRWPGQGHGGEPAAGSPQDGVGQRAAGAPDGLASGWLDLAVFDQGVWWANRDGLPFRIASEMSPAYLANLVEFLQQWAGYFRAETVRRLLVTMVDPTETPTVDADGAHLLVAAAAEDPQTWLEATPLMRALRAALARSPGHGVRPPDEGGEVCGEPLGG